MEKTLKNPLSLTFQAEVMKEMKKYKLCSCGEVIRTESGHCRLCSNRYAGENNRIVHNQAFKRKFGGKNEIDLCTVCEFNQGNRKRLRKNFINELVLERISCRWLGNVITPTFRCASFLKREASVSTRLLPKVSLKSQH